MGADKSVSISKVIPMKFQLNRIEPKTTAVKLFKLDLENAIEKRLNPLEMKICFVMATTLDPSHKKDAFHRRI